MCRTRNRGPANNRTHTHHRRGSFGKRRANSWHSENRSNTRNRVAWTEDNGFSTCDRVEQPRRRGALLDAGKAHLCYFRRPAILDKIFLKGNFSLRRDEAGFNPIIGHGQKPRVDAKFSANHAANLGELSALVQKPGPRNMSSQVFIPELEPTVVT